MSGNSKLCEEFEMLRRKDKILFRMLGDIVMKWDPMPKKCVNEYSLPNVSLRSWVLHGMFLPVIFTKGADQNYITGMWGESLF